MVVVCGNPPGIVVVVVLQACVLSPSTDLAGLAGVTGVTGLVGLLGAGCTTDDSRTTATAGTGTGLASSDARRVGNKSMTREDNGGFLRHLAGYTGSQRARLGP